MAKLDDQQFDRLLKQKLDARILPAPEELWSSIDEGLDLAEAQDKKLDQELKEQMGSFERKAPASLWGAIEGSLAQPETLDGNELLDQKVRESYQSQQTAPEQIWHNIDQQLNVDHIWRNMQPGLSQMRKGYIWRKRLRQISVAAMFLLLIRGCGLNFLPDNLLESSEQTIAQNSNISKGQGVKEKFHTAPLAQQQQDIKAQQQQQPTVTKTYPRTPANKQASPQKAGQKKTVSNQEDQTQAVLAFAHKVIEQHATYQDDPKALDAPIEGRGSEHKSFRKQVIPSLLDKVIDQEQSSDLLPILKDLKPLNSKPHRSTYQEVGLIAAFHHTVIINDARPKSLISQMASRVDKKILAAPAFGLFIDHHFRPKQAVSFEFWWDARVRQQYNYAYAGKQLSEEIQLRYVKAAVSYELNVLNYSFLNSQQKLLLKAGAYVANLQAQRQLSKNQHETNLPLEELKSWDSGLLLSLEQEHQLHPKLFFAYGLRSEIGLTSLMKLSSATNNVPSNLLNFGFLARLSYRL